MEFYYQKSASRDLWACKSSIKAKTITVYLVWSWERESWRFYKIIKQRLLWLLAAAEERFVGCVLIPGRQLVLHRQPANTSPHRRDSNTVRHPSDHFWSLKASMDSFAKTEHLFWLSFFETVYKTTKFASITLTQRSPLKCFFLHQNIYRSIQDTNSLY